jgi:histidine ammonia-lyase
MQAVEYRGVEKMASKTRVFYEAARKVVPSITKDRVFSKDIEAATQWLKTLDWYAFAKKMTTTNQH